MARSIVSSRRSSDNISPFSQDEPVPWVTEPPKNLNGLLYHDMFERAFANAPMGGQNNFCESSVGDIFEVDLINGGVVQEKVTDGTISTWVNKPSVPVVGNKLRILFLDAIPSQPDKLPITSSLLRDVFAKWEVNPRFSDFMSRQHMPGRDMRRKRASGETRHEMWYSAVLRADGMPLVHEERWTHLQLSRQVAYWQRYCIWGDSRQRSDSDGSEHSLATYFIWRCPLDTKEAFFRTFTGQRGKKLLDHPLAVHAFIMERIIMYGYDFLAAYVTPLYKLEGQALDQLLPADQGLRSRTSQNLSRQLHAIATDYDILDASIDHLKRQSEWFRNNLRPRPGCELDLDAAETTVEEILENLAKEAQLCVTYLTLYLERCKMVVNEVFATITQKDSEINVQIAQASYQDNRSLRIIQILSMIFLPGSFISSIFGMGFFTTEASDLGGDNGIFIVSGRWWLYFAVSVPVTVAIMAIAMYYQRRDTNKAEQEWTRRKSQVADPEAQSLEKTKSL